MALLLLYYAERQKERLMAQGTIKKKTDKGFGFITDNDGGNDIFFHMSALQDVNFDDLYEGQSVEYTVGSGPKGPRAEDVRLS